jgi:hypothetical protein
MPDHLIQLERGLHGGWENSRAINGPLPLLNLLPGPETKLDLSNPDLGLRSILKAFDFKLDDPISNELN